MMTGAPRTPRRRGTGKYERTIGPLQGHGGGSDGGRPPVRRRLARRRGRGGPGGDHHPYSVGPAEKIRRAAKESKLDISPYEVVDAPS